MFPIYCLMYGGRALTDEMRTVLFCAAAEMVKQRNRKQKFKADCIEGEVRTEFQGQALGPVAGIKFSAEIDSDRGQTTVDYLVRENDLEALDMVDAHWFQVYSDVEKSRQAGLN